MYLNEHYQMKKTILAVFLTFAFLQSNSCSCFEGFKGYKDYPMTLGLAAKVIQQLTLLEVMEKDSTGIKAKILKDYCNAYDFDTVFIANKDPGWQCGYSTDEFEKGNLILTVLATNEYQNYFSTCYESFIDVSGNSTNGLIEISIEAKAKELAIFKLYEKKNPAVLM